MINILSLLLEVVILGYENYLLHVVNTSESVFEMVDDKRVIKEKYGAKNMVMFSVFLRGCVLSLSIWYLAINNIIPLYSIPVCKGFILGNITVDFHTIKIVRRRALQKGRSWKWW